MQSQFEKNTAYRIRFLLSKSGKIKVEYARMALKPSDGVKYITVSKKKTNPENVFLYHKTTNRSLYDTEYQHYWRQGYYDVIFTNCRNEVTEGAITNIFIKTPTDYFTPPVSSGLLPGIYRKILIKRWQAKEKVLFTYDLMKAEKIFLCNSVRGVAEVTFKNRPSATKRAVS